MKSICFGLQKLPLFVYLLSTLSRDSMQTDEAYARMNAVATHVALSQTAPETANCKSSSVKLWTKPERVAAVAQK